MLSLPLVSTYDDKEPRVTRRDCRTGVLVSWTPCSSNLDWFREPALTSWGRFVTVNTTCLERLSGSSLESSFPELVPKYCCVCCNFTAFLPSVSFMYSENGTLTDVVAEVLLFNLVFELQESCSSDGLDLVAEELLGSSVAIIIELFSSLYDPKLENPVLEEYSISILGVS